MGLRSRKYPVLPVCSFLSSLILHTCVFPWLIGQFWHTCLDLSYLNPPPGAWGLLDCLCVHARLAAVILPASIWPTLCLLPVCSHLLEFFFMRIINLWDYFSGLFWGHCKVHLWFFCVASGSRSLWHLQRILWLPMRICYALFVKHHQKKSPVSQSCFFSPLDLYIPFGSAGTYPGCIWVKAG